jgi:hypothetical protein
VVVLVDSLFGFVDGVELNEGEGDALLLLEGDVFDCTVLFEKFAEVVLSGLI